MAFKKGTSLVSNSDRRLLKALGARIREIRKHKRLSVYDVTGDDLKIKSRQHWQQIELGQKSLTFVTFCKIAESLEVQLIELIKGLR